MQARVSGLNVIRNSVVLVEVVVLVVVTVVAVWARAVPVTQHGARQDPGGQGFRYSNHRQVSASRPPAFRSAAPVVMSSSV